MNVYRNLNYVNWLHRKQKKYKKKQKNNWLKLELYALIINEYHVWTHNEIIIIDSILSTKERRWILIDGQIRSNKQIHT